MCTSSHHYMEIFPCNPVDYHDLSIPCHMAIGEQVQVPSLKCIPTLEGRHVYSTAPPERIVQGTPTSELSP